MLYQFNGLIKREDFIELLGLGNPEEITVSDVKVNDKGDLEVRLIGTEQNPVPELGHFAPRYGEAPMVDLMAKLKKPTTPIWEK